MAGIFVSECQEGLPVPVPCASLDVQAYTRAAPDKTTGNEDRAATFEPGEASVVLAVADGLGGMPAGDEASQLAIETLDRKLAAAAGDVPLRSHIIDAFEEANRHIRELGGGAGTTFAVAEIEAGRLRTYHVGDSAVLAVGQRGRIKLETIAHSPVGYGVAAGLIEPEEALHHDDRHYLSNHLGAQDMHIVVGSPIPLARRDTVLLATDGLFDNLHPTEIVDRIRKGPLAGAARGLATTCSARMKGRSGESPAKPDDATFILARGRDGFDADRGTSAPGAGSRASSGGGRRV